MTCAELDIVLCDYLDGALDAPARVTERRELEQHLSSCAACAELARDARAAVAFIDRAADVEPPPALVTRMFEIPARKQPRAGGGVRNWFHNLLQPVLQPKVVMGFSLTILSFAMMARCVGVPEKRLSAADLNPVKVWGALDDRLHRSWERTVMYYESIRFVYQVQSKLREWQEKQDEQSPPAPAPPDRKTDQKTDQKNDEKRLQTH